MPILPKSQILRILPMICIFFLTVNVFAMQNSPDMVLLPSGEFEMGDHHDLGGKEHPSDEIPVHIVKLNSFQIGRTEVTTTQYIQFLNAALEAKQIAVNKAGQVTSSDGKTVYCDTSHSDKASRIEWNSKAFSFPKNKADHPVVCIRWKGAAVYCNWLSKQRGLEPCYNTSTWKCDFTKNGYRLPTEAEWEYAARGGKYPPYTVYTHGNKVNNSIANLPNSGDPFEAGQYPWTTPVGFYDGKLKRKADFNWPGRQSSFQTEDGANGYGLYDMQGNVWEWVNDWYQHNYYETSPSVNPQGPETGRVMRDGKRYHACRSGNWYNGFDGHSRASNRNVAYYRGPNDPDHSWYHFGFRIARNGDTAPKEGKPNISKTIPQQPWLIAHAQELDADGDGKVAKKEMMAEAEKAFLLYDANHDGRIAKTELNGRRMAKSVMGGFIKLHSAELDSNSDGNIAKAELLDESGYLFDKSDRNRDGLISSDQQNERRKRDEGRSNSRQGERNRRGNRRGTQTPGRQMQGNRRPKRQDSQSSQRQPHRSPEESFGEVERQIGLIKNSSEAFPGYTLFAPKHYTKTYLMRNDGQIVNTWESQYEPGQSVYLLENGHLLRCCLTKNKAFIGGGEGGRLEEYDWNGNLVWEFWLSDDKNLMHHDIAIMPNGNILAITTLWTSSVLMHSCLLNETHVGEKEIPIHVRHTVNRLP